MWDGVGGVEIGGDKKSLGSGNLHVNSIIMDKRAKNSIQDNWLRRCELNLWHWFCGNISTVYVCKKELPEHVWRAVSLPANNVGFMNNEGNVFTGEQSDQHFQAVVLAFKSQVRDTASSSNRNNIRWYHPLKFPESWTSLLAPTKDGLKADSSKYNGKLVDLK